MKTIKITGIIVIGLALLITIVSLIAGPIARNYVNKHGLDLLGRSTRLEHVRTNLWTGHVTVEGLQVNERDDSAPFLLIDTIDVSLRLRSLLTHSIHVRHITLAGLNATIEQQGSEFNFSDIIDHFATSDTDTTAEPDKPWKMAFYNIRFSHWKLHYDDIAVGSHLHLDDINLAIPGVYFDGHCPTEAGLALHLSDGGTLHTQLEYNMESQDFKIDLRLDSINLQNFEAYLTHSLRISRVCGIAQADIQASGNLSSVLATTIGGSIDLNQISVSDAVPTPLLHVDHLGIKARRVVLATNLYHIEEVTVNGLSTRFDRYTDGNNFTRLIPPSTDNTPSTIPSESHDVQSQPLQLTIDRFRINDAHIVVNDHTLAKPFTYPIDHIQVAADHITLTGVNSATITASLPHSAQLQAQWNGTIQPIGQQQDLELNLTGLRLADFSPYTLTYLAYPFVDGLFSFRSHNTITRNQLEGINTIDIYHPEVGPRCRDIDSAMHVPLRLALDLLTDKDGKILIEVPVSGNIQSPQFNYMSAVWNTLRQLLVKVATSPIRGVARLIGIDAQGLDFVAFDPAQTTQLNSEQLYKLQQLSTIVLADSTINVTLRQRLTDTDSLSLANATHRNTAVLQQLSHMGVPPQRIIVETSTESRARRCGYEVLSHSSSDK